MMGYEILNKEEPKSIAKRTKPEEIIENCEELIERIKAVVREYIATGTNILTDYIREDGGRIVIISYNGLNIYACCNKTKKELQNK